MNPIGGEWDFHETGGFTSHAIGELLFMELGSGG